MKTKARQILNTLWKRGRDFLGVVAPGPVLGKLVDRAYAVQIDQGIRDKEILIKMVLDEYKTGRNK